MEFSPEEHRQAIFHAGSIPSRYIFARRDELLDDVLENDISNDYTDEAQQNLEVVEGFTQRLTNFMILCDPKLYEEFTRMAHIASVHEGYPEVIKPQDQLDLTGEGQSVLSGCLFAYYTGTQYMYEKKQIAPIATEFTRNFYPVGTSRITKESMIQRRAVVRQLGKKVFEKIGGSWAPVLSQWPEVFGGKDKLPHAEIGIGYASDCLTDINKRQIDFHNYKIANTEGYLASKELEDLSNEELWKNLT